MQAMKFLPYTAGGANPRLVLGASVFCPRAWDWANVDNWLCQHLGVMQESFDDACAAHLGWHTTTDEQKMALRSLAAYPVLAKACRIPVFEAGQVLSLEPQAEKAGSWLVKASVPFVDGLESTLAEYLLRQAFVLITKLSPLPITPDSIERLYQELDQQLVARLKKYMPGGATTMPVCEAAHKLNIPFRHQGGGIIQLGWGAKAQWMDRSACRQDSAHAAKLSHDKQFTASILRRAGLPCPEHVLARNAQQALAAAADLGWPVVVKPANRDRGEGVTVGVKNEAQLEAAFGQARSWSPRVLIERQVTGVCHRLMVVGNTVTVAGKRRPKSVKGDGVSTVEKLVDLANGALRKVPPWRRLKPFILDAMALDCLVQEGLAPDSIPLDGQFAPLRPIQSDEWGGVAQDMLDCIHPDNVRAATDAAAVLGLRVAGVDMISPDISQPWHSNGAVINEVNFAPFVGGNADAPSIRAFMAALVEGDGRIPVWVVVGAGDVFPRAKELQSKLTEAGLQAFVTSATRTETAQGHALPMSCSSLFDRCLALTMNWQVQAMVVVDTDELLSTGLPFDWIDKVFVDDEIATTHLEMLRYLRRYAPQG